jgi:hypothetical protein
MKHAIGVQVVADGLTARETACLERAISAVNGLQSQFQVHEAIRKITLPGKRKLLSGVPLIVENEFADGKRYRT